MVLHGSLSAVPYLGTGSNGISLSSFSLFFQGFSQLGCKRPVNPIFQRRSGFDKLVASLKGASDVEGFAAGSAA